jgi:2'-5' RNA ligase
MRAFIAIDLPPAIKDKLTPIQDQVKVSDPLAKWVAPKNIHITLKFLGEIAPEKIEPIAQAMQAVVAWLKVFPLNLKGFGFFPNEPRARVVFVNIADDEKLLSLAHILETKLETLGFERSDQFKSHVTLARLKNPDNVKFIKRTMDTLSVDESFDVEKITLFKSMLTANGPIYEVLTEAALLK